MGYQHINNLYKDTKILMFSECFALEKIHGTSSHITWKAKEKKLIFYPGSENYDDFVALFNVPELKKLLSNNFPDSDVRIYGEAYGGKQQGMSEVYGDQLRFVCFDIKINDTWLTVPKADSMAWKLNIQFVHFVKVSTEIEVLNRERDRPSVQAERNGMGKDKIREGVVLRPTIELKTEDGSRIIAKHRRSEFSETNSNREVNFDELKVLEDAQEIADEWVTEMRLNHVLDKLPNELTIRDMKMVIDAMVEDVLREAEGEIIESKEVIKSIGTKTSELFKNKILK